MRQALGGRASGFAALILAAVLAACTPGTPGAAPVSPVPQGLPAPSNSTFASSGGHDSGAEVLAFSSRVAAVALLALDPGMVGAEAGVSPETAIPQPDPPSGKSNGNGDGNGNAGGSGGGNAP